MTTATTFNTELFNELTEGTVYTPTFVPFKASRNKGEKQPSINWIVTLIRNGKSISVEYSQGTGCVSERDAKLIKRLVRPVQHSGRRSMDVARLESGMCETGWIGTPNNVFGKGKQLDPPELKTVVWCLLEDGTAVDNGSFEDWADELGYDKDSRSAEAIYRACLDTGLKMRAMFGDATISKLRELFQDF